MSTRALDCYDEKRKTLFKNKVEKYMVVNC